VTPLHLFAPVYRVHECLAEIRACLESGWTGLGGRTLAFEEAFKAYATLPHAHFVASATAGLHLAIRLLKEQRGWQDGDEIITTPLTFVSTNHAILYEHLKPVFADVDEHLCLDPNSVAERITLKTRAVMFVGLGGNPGKLAKLAELCRSKSLALILDAAHMTGSRINGSPVGHEADAAVFSFHSVKNLPTADGGMVAFRDASLDAEVRKWSWLGINKNTFERTQQSGSYRWAYDVEKVGFKYHGNSIMAALGLVGLRHVEEDNVVRRKLVTHYEELLEGCRDISFIPIPKGCVSSRHLFQLLVNRRDELMVHLNEQQVFPGVHYRDNTEYPMYADQAGRCPRAASASRHVISLPLHLRMEEADVERVAAAIRRFYEGPGS
jgi:dTDP-4-amino-4,6-dideoxygalactose transaminase